MIAYDYPLLGAFWTMLWLFLWIAWIITLFRVIGDVLGAPDLGGWAKGIWLVFVILMPFLGVLVYAIVRGDKIAQHDLDRARAREQSFNAAVRDAAGTSGGGTATELVKLADLRDRGVLTDAEFSAQKARLLA